MVIIIIIIKTICNAHKRVLFPNEATAVKLRSDVHNKALTAYIHFTHRKIERTVIKCFIIYSQATLNTKMVQLLGNSVPGPDPLTCPSLMKSRSRSKKC